ENHVFMVNLDGAGRGTRGVFSLQGWPEANSYFRKMLGAMYEGHITVGDRISPYSDMYNFAAVGIPSSSYASAEPVSGGAPRGWGHTYWDTLDKINPRAIQMDGILIARILLRLATEEALPLVKKTPSDFATKLKEMGLDAVLRYELRPIPGE
ncbi:MAG: M28 family peptidase, partial [Bacillota bacterium]